MPHEPTHATDPYVGLYADALGRGVQVAQPVAAPNQAQFNQQTLRPYGGSNQGMVNASPSFMGAPASAVAAEGQAPQEVQEEGQEVRTEDYLASLFNGESLSEAFKEKAKLIFTAALHEKISIVEKAILEANAAVLKEELEKGLAQGLQEGMNYLAESVDEYLTYVGKEWLVENKLEVESGFRTEIAENFMNGLKSLFENSFMEVPEEKVDIVEDLFDQNDKIEATLNSAIQENMQLRSALGAQLCAEQFVKIATGLTDTEVEKLAVLTETLEFDSVEQYAQKVQILKESYFGQKLVPSGTSVSSRTIDNYNGTPNTSINTNNSVLMEGYVNAISRQLKLTNSVKI